MKYIIVLFIFISSSADSQAVRKYSNEFLKIGVGAKNLSLGGSMAVGEGDPTAVFYNPSSLSGIDKVSISAMHNAYFAGIANFDYAGLIIPMKDGQSLGLSIVRLGIDNIPNTINLYNPDGSINYDNIESFSVSDMALYLSFGKLVRDTLGLSIGGNVKIIKRDYGSFANAWGFGIDLAAQIQREKYSLGLFAQDLTTTFSAWSFNFTEKEKEVFAATGNEIPSSSSEITLPSIHFGGNYHFYSVDKKYILTPYGKLTMYTDKRNVLLPIGPLSLDPSLGIELGIHKLAFIRAGIHNFTKATNDLGEEYLSYMPSLGAGVKIGDFAVDYSFNNVGNAGVGLYSHVFSATIKLKKKEKFQSSTFIPSSNPNDIITP